MTGQGEGDGPERGAGGPAPAEGVRRRRAVQAAAVVATLAVGVLVGFLIGRGGTDPAPGESAVTVTASATPSPTGSATGTAAGTSASPSTSAGTGDGPDASTLPLRDPLVPRFDGSTASIASATPGEGDLADGDYVGHLQDVDPAALTVTVDLVIFLGGQAADDWAAAHPPAEVLDDYWIVDDVPRSRVLPVDPGVVVVTTCTRSPDALEEPALLRRPFPEWAAGTTGTVGCAAPDPGLRQATDLYWFDVRGGVVVQVVGQYVP